MEDYKTRRDRLARTNRKWIRMEVDQTILNRFNKEREKRSKKEGLIYTQTRALTEAMSMWINR